MKKAFFLITILFTACFSSFGQTYRVLVKDNGWGYINLNGDQVIPSQKKGAFKSFSADGYATVYQASNTTVYFLDTAGKRIDPEKKYHINTRAGANPDVFENGLIPFQYKGRWGYLNTKCEIAIEPKYWEAAPFSEGYAIVSTHEIIIVDVNGVETPIKVDDVSKVKKFTEGLAPFEQNKLMGFIDSKGQAAIPAKFVGVGYFSGGLAWARVLHNNQKIIGFIDRKGDWVIEPAFSVVGNFDASSGLARVKKGDEWFYVRKDGSTFLPTGVDKFHDFYDGMAVAEKDKLIGFLNPEGHWAIEPLFSDARHFKNGYAAVKQDGKWGIINKKGEWVVKPAYDAMKDVEVIE